MAAESSIADKDDLGLRVARGGDESKIIGLGSAYLQRLVAALQLCPSASCHFGDDIHGSRKSK